MKRELSSIIGLVVLAGVARAGELNVIGNVGVGSNLTVQTLTLGGQTRSSWPSATEGSAATLSNGVLDTSLASFYSLTLTTNVVWDFQGHAAGRTFTLKVAQDSVGGWTNDWGTNVLWAGGVKWPALTTQAERWDLVRFVDDGVNWLGIVEGKGYRIPCTTNCNSAVAFDGSQNFAEALIQNVTFPACTTELWFRARSAAGDVPGILSTAHDDDPVYGDNALATFSIFTAAARPDLGNRIIFYMNWGGLGAVSAELDPIGEGGWHHLAGVWDGSEMRLYYDGNLVATTNAVGSAIEANCYQRLAYQGTHGGVTLAAILTRCA